LQAGCELVGIDVFDQNALAAQLKDCDAAINLIGILNESGPNKGFRRIHVELTNTLVDACHDAKVRRLLHMSALNADTTNGTSQYLRSKGEGESRVHTRGKAGMAVTSFRPSVIFGNDDSFINRFAALLRLPGPFPLACPQARFAPVYVGDVASAFCNSLDDPSTFGQRYELCGPGVFTLEEIERYIADMMGKRKRVIRLGDRLSQFQAHALELIPGKPFTRDNYLSMRLPSVCSEDGLGRLGIEPTPMSAIVPQFLQGQTRRGQLMSLRQRVE
jgi:NADH dehydrogenase